MVKPEIHVLTEIDVSRDNGIYLPVRTPNARDTRRHNNPTHFERTGEPSHMTIITVEGRVGAGAPDLGRLVARELEIDFVDRLILAQIAREVNATMRALVDQERRVPSLVNRLALRVQRVLERSAVAGMGGDPYFGPGVEDLISRQYSEYAEEPHTTAEEVDDERFIKATREVILDIADQDNIVILSRGGAAILRDNPKVLRVGVVARMEDRAKRIAERETSTWKRLSSSSPTPTTHSTDTSKKPSDPAPSTRSSTTSCGTHPTSASTTQLE